MRWRGTRCAVLLGATLAIGATGGSQTPTAPLVRENAYRANNLGVALLEQFKFEEAAAAFREALKLQPDLGIGHFNLGLALLHAGDVDAATTEAAAADRLLPTAPQPAYLLGVIARTENRDADASRFFGRVRDIDPRDGGTAVNLAQIAIQDRRYADAIELLQAAVADEPYNITAVYNLGMAMTRAGQRDEGQRLMERSQALRETGYGTTLSSSYLEQGKYAEALASTGAESELVDPATPRVAFTLSTVPAGGTAPSASATPSPYGRTYAAADLTPDGARRIAAALGGGLTTIDADGDGDFDLVVAAPDGERLLRNDGGTFTDVTAASGLGDRPGASVPIGAVAGDIDNDGIPDLFVLRYGASALYKNDGQGHFTNITAASGIPAFPFLPGAAALVDVDHDGDLDLVVAGLADIEASRARATGRSLAFPDEFAPAPVVLLRNNGDGTFTDITRTAKIDVATHAIAIVPTDFDNHRDIDLLVASHDGPPVLLKNLRDGSFANVASEVGLAPVSAGGSGFTTAAAADVNKDGYPDFYFGRSQGPGVLALSDRRGRFTVAPAPEAARAALASLFFDYDNDGLLDLLTWSLDGPHIARHLAASWSDVTTAAFPAPGPPGASIASPRALAVADLDGDGRDDVVALNATGTVGVWRAGGTGTNRSVRIRLKGRVSNRSAIGSKVQIRAGSLEQRLELSAATPAVVPADLIFGLGQRAGADVARVLWPSGILQAEYAGASEAGAPAPVTPAPLPAALSVEELNRKPSSCPFLYTWNGNRFEFVTDFLGGGEMGYWEGPGKYNSPDPVEFVRIREDQLRQKDGHYELRVTNELEETLFIDRLQLVTIEHPSDVAVFPNEGMTDPPKPFRLFAVKDARAVSSVSDDRGRDLTARVSTLDRKYADGFQLLPIRGYAAPHDLVIDLGAIPSQPVLLLTGWTDYAFSSDNVAAHQRELALVPPSLDVRATNGGWRSAISDIGIPVGRPQTIVVDLASVLRGDEHVVRIRTNMRIYWDQILVGSAADAGGLRITRIDPATALLRERGYSLEVRPDGMEPPVYDYGRVVHDSPWKTMPGLYTREGDVKELLSDSDDLFVIAKPGDEIAVAFAAPPGHALAQGRSRTFLLMGDGYSKEMDVNSAGPDRAEPLPFHRMSGYPYGQSQRYPDSRRHREYRGRYNTRRVVSPLPPLDNGAGRTTGVRH